MDLQLEPLSQPEAIAALTARLHEVAEQMYRSNPTPPEDPVRAISEMNRIYWRLVRESGRESEILEGTAREKEAERRAIKDFIARHTPVEPDVVVEL